jgi:CheY-like chemotaxis protein
MSELNQLEKCDFCNNGEEAIERAKRLIVDALSKYDDAIEKPFSIRPISLLLLDFQMPKKNGIEVI